MPRKRIKRENGTGSVYKRGDLKRRPWVAVAPAKLKIDPITHKLQTVQPVLGYFATEREANDILDMYCQSPSTKFNITLEELHKEWMTIAYRDISQQSIDNYNSSWYKLRPLYKDKVRNIRTAAMQSIIDYYDSDHQKEGAGGVPLTDKATGEPIMRGPLSFSALSKLKALLTSMYKYAMQNDVVNKNYASFIELPPSGEAKKDRFTEDELHRIRDAVGKVPLANYVFAMCNLGHRIGEFLALEKGDVFFRDGMMIIYGGNKTEAGERKIVPVNSAIQPIVEQQLAMGGQTLFCRPDGTPWTTDNFRNHFKNCLSEIGVRVLTPHATRRTFSTRLSAAGVSREDIIALMGHTDFEVDIQHYINQEAKTLYKAVQKISV